MPIDTKQILKTNLDKLGSTDLPERYKAICQDYVSCMSASDICTKYNIGHSRLYYILRYSARTLDFRQ